jgi:hypothetical protein
MAIQALRDRGLSVKEAIEHIIRVENGGVETLPLKKKSASDNQKQRLSA